MWWVWGAVGTDGKLLNKHWADIQGIATGTRLDPEGWKEHRKEKACEKMSCLGWPVPANAGIGHIAVCQGLKTRLGHSS